MIAFILKIRTFWFLCYWTNCTNTMHGMQHITHTYTHSLTCAHASAPKYHVCHTTTTDIEQTLADLLEWDFFFFGNSNSTSTSSWLLNGEQIQTDDHTVLFVISNLLMCVRLHCCAAAVAATTATSFSLRSSCFCFPLPYYCLKIIIMVVVAAVAVAVAARTAVAVISLVLFVLFCC